MHAQHSAVYRFTSLNNFSISESRDAKYFEHVFPSRKNVSTCVYVNLLVHDNVHVSASSSVARFSIGESRMSKRRRVKTSFSPDFHTNFLIEDFDVNLLSDELVPAFIIEEDTKTYREVMRFIDINFLKRSYSK